MPRCETGQQRPVRAEGEQTQLNSLIALTSNGKSETSENDLCLGAYNMKMKIQDS